MRNFSEMSREAQKVAEGIVSRLDVEMASEGGLKSVEPQKEGAKVWNKVTTTHCKADACKKVVMTMMAEMPAQSDSTKVKYASDEALVKVSPDFVTTFPGEELVELPSTKDKRMRIPHDAVREHMAALLGDSFEDTKGTLRKYWLGDEEVLELFIPFTKREPEKPLYTTLASGGTDDGRLKVKFYESPGRCYYRIDCDKRLGWDYLNRMLFCPRTLRTLAAICKYDEDKRCLELKNKGGMAEA